METEVKTYTHCQACGWSKRNDDPTVPWCNRAPKCKRQCNQTPAQRARQNRRVSGQYEAHRCDGCGGPAPMEYYSERRSDDLINDELLILCKKCYQRFDAMSDADLLAFLKGGR